MKTLLKILGVVLACACIVISIVLFCIEIDDYVLNLHKPATHFVYTKSRIQQILHEDMRSVHSVVKENVHTVILIPSVIQWQHRRDPLVKQYMRENWGNLVQLVFIFGSKSGTQLEIDINTSSVEHYNTSTTNIRNIFTVCRDYGDEFNNPNGTSATTCKMYEGFKYVAKHFNAIFVWRGADDAYLNLQLFFSMQHLIPRERLYFGYLRRIQRGQAQDLLLSKQPALRDLLGIQQFGSYMAGMGYLMTYDVVEFLGTLSIPPRLLWCEDVMIGFWLRPFDINFVDSSEGYNLRLYNRQDIPRGAHSILLVHYIKQEDWDMIDSNGDFAVADKRNWF
jgi:hypothetical protein